MPSRFPPKNQLPAFLKTSLRRFNSSTFIRFSPLRHETLLCNPPTRKPTFRSTTAATSVQPPPYKKPRRSKRKLSTEAASTSRSKKRKMRRTSNVRPTNATPPRPPSPIEEVIPTGYPFVEYEVDWEYIRYHLHDRPNKTMFMGYEQMAGDVRVLLETLPINCLQKVQNSVMGTFSHLPDYSTRSGKMIHYVISREVKPSPNFDRTALWFKIGDKVLRFSRVEYALVSGLKFGRAEFNPYKRHQLPPDSIYERLFGANPETTTAMVRTAYIDKHFEVNGEEVKATDEDYVQLSKFLLALTFALGIDQTKKKIPLWLWVLLENKEKWEAFPWGSYSYQLLIDSIQKVQKTERDTKTDRVSYHIKGNTIAFSAWIFEAIPAFGRVIGYKKTERQRPRFLRYKYVKEKGFPEEEEIIQGLVPMLKPHKKELGKKYWKSLKNDPEGEPFVFQFDAFESKKKKPRDADEDEEIPNTGNGTANTTVTATTTATAPVNEEMMQRMADIAAEKAKTSFEQMIHSYHQTLVDDVTENVIKKLLDRVPECTNQATEANKQTGVQMPTASGGSSTVVKMAGTVEGEKEASEKQDGSKTENEMEKETEEGDETNRIEVDEEADQINRMEVDESEEDGGYEEQREEENIAETVEATPTTEEAQREGPDQVP